MNVNMNAIDPKLLAAWLKTELLSSADVTSASLGGGLGSMASGAGAAGPDFADLLQLLTSEGNGTSISEGMLGGAFGLQELTSRIPLFWSASAASETLPSSVSDDTEAIIRDAAARYGVDASLVRAVIRAESGFDPNAESRAGAKGLMQLMDQTAASLGVTDSFDPVQNVHGGTRFLSFLLTKYNGNTSVALAAYNAGPGRVDRLGIRTDAELAMAMDRLPEETQDYVRKVMEWNNG